jgi:dynein heavy chain
MELQVGRINGNKRAKDEDITKWLPALPTRRMKPDWQDISPQFKLFPGVTPEMAGVNQRPHTNTISGLPSLLRPDRAEGNSRNIQTASQRTRSKSWDPRLPPSKRKTTSIHQPSPRPITAQRQREDFRHALVRMILNYPEDETDSDKTSAAEKDTLRYLYYIQRGIDTIHVAPLESSWLNHVMGLLSPHLKSSPHLSGLLENLCDEMRDDYLLGVKKSIIDFVLRDPHKSPEEQPPVDKPLHRAELDVVPKPWNKHFIQSYEVLSDTLFITNPLLLQVLSGWYKEYCMFRFVNEMTLLNHFEPMELQLYQTLVMKDIETTKAVLQKKWFPEVQNIFYRGNKRKQIPFTRLDPFFESVAVLMTNLLRELTLDSITEYREVFSPLPNKDKVGIFPGFVLSAVVNGTSVEFEPSPHGFEIVIINVFDKMIEASCSLPRVESKLYPSEVNFLSLSSSIHHCHCPYRVHIQLSLTCIHI